MFWEKGFKYDRILRGWKFDDKTTLEQADKKRADLKALYGGLM